MKAFAQFIVTQRKKLFCLFMVLTALSVVGIFATNINKDMTKYIPEDMPSKIGNTLMNQEFGETSQFSIMYKGLSEEQRSQVASDLEKVQGVTSVIHEETSDYLNGDASLFVATCNGDSYSTEAHNTWQGICAYGDFQGYEYYIDSAVIDAQPIELGLIIIVGVAFVIVIMVLMSHAWIETPMLLGAIGIAILLNMGSNVFLPSVSDTTFSIAAVLQLVLSLDYSLMLMSRYRRERATNPDKESAMVDALVGASKSIASSSVTTIVGLLCLVFMSFTIGADMGVVLAKGVFLSLVCVFFIMPFIILAADHLLSTTAKRSPIPSMQRVTNAAYKLRVPFTICFCLLLAVGFTFRNASGTTFFMASENPDRPVIQQYFDLDSQVVVLYKSSEEEAFAKLSSQIEGMDNVSSLNCYANTLGKQMDAKDLAKDLDMDQAFIKLLYYRHFGNQDITLTPNQLALSLRDEVRGEEAFAKEMEGISTSDLNTLVDLTDPGKIQKQRTAKDMASYLAAGSNKGISTSDMQLMYLAYYLEHGGVDLGTMTLPQFVNFMQDDVAKSSLLASRVSKDQLKRIDQMATFTNVSAMTKQRSAASMAKLLGIDKTQVETLYRVHGALSGTADPGKQTLGTVLNFLLNSASSDPRFSGLITEEMKQQIQGALATIPEDQLNTSLAPDEMSQLLASFGMDLDAQLLNSIYIAIWVMTPGDPGTTMSCQQFLNFLCDDLLSSPEATAIAGTSANLDEATIKQLTTAQGIVNDSVKGTAYTYKQLAKRLDMKKADTKQLYCYNQWNQGGKNTWTLNALTAVDFLVAQSASGGTMADQASRSQRTQLTGLQNLMSASVSGSTYGPKKMAELFAPLSSEMDASKMELMYLLYGSMHHYSKSWTMSLDQFLTFMKNDVLDDPLFSSQISKDQRQDISDGYDQMMEGKKRLVGQTYSMAVLTVPYSDESPQMKDVLNQLRSTLDANLTEEYLIGQGAMANEMSASFTDEFNFISLLTALAIFLIVALTFRSVAIPLLLVLLIQCAFCLTMGINSLLGSSIYYVALIVVQAILMGAAIDYAILFTNNYREARAENGIRDAIALAYQGSVRTMLTSGVVLVSVTGLMGIGCSGIVAQICLVISQGCAIALLLVMFLLPSLLAVLDKLVMGKKLAADPHKDIEVKIYRI